jgi:hypothetical protein
MRNTKPEELDVVLGAALFAASESAQSRPSVDAWQRRTEIIENFLSDGGSVEDIAFPTTGRDDGRIEFRLSDEFMEYLVTNYYTQALIEFYEEAQ